MIPSGIFVWVCLHYYCGAWCWHASFYLFDSRWIGSVNVRIVLVSFLFTGGSRQAVKCDRQTFLGWGGQKRWKEAKHSSWYIVSKVTLSLTGGGICFMLFFIYLYFLVLCIRWPKLVNVVSKWLLLYGTVLCFQAYSLHSCCMWFWMND